MRAKTKYDYDQAVGKPIYRTNEEILKMQIRHMNEFNRLYAHATPNKNIGGKYDKTED